MSRHLLGPTGALLALFLLPAAARQAAAQDDDDSVFDIDLDEIDLGSNSNLSESLTYQGVASHQAPNYKPGTPVTITHYAGTISVRCTDQEGLTARIQYTIDGTDKAAMERVGKGIRISTWASNSSGSVRTSVPGKPKGVDRIEAPLVVNLPLEARVVVQGRDDWIQVMGCKGTVKASTRKNGIYVQGTYSQFDLSAGTGNVDVDLTDDSVIQKNSRAVASSGDITLRLPLTQGATLVATGSQVEVAHLVSGTNTPTRVQGTINDGGPTITLQAKGKVTVEAPK